MTNPQHEALVEAVARAIYDASHVGISNCYAWDDCWEDHQESRRPRYYKEARAAIAALSATAATPSDEVVRLRSAHDQLEKTAREYATHYMQDEADSEEDCVCGREQHLRAVAVFDALDDVARARAALEPQGKDL